MKNKQRKILNFLLLIIITSLVLFFSLKGDFEATLHQILTLNIWWLLVAIFLVVSYWFFKSMSLYSQIHMFKESYTFGQAFKLAILTQFFNAVTPFSSGGQPFQILTLKKQGVNMSSGTSIIMQNFIVYQIALVALGVIAISSNHFLHLFSETGPIQHLVNLGFIINFLVIVGMFIIAFGRRVNHYLFKKAIVFLNKINLVKDKEAVLEKWYKNVDEFHDGARGLMEDKKKFIKDILTNFMGLICLYLVPMVVMFSMGNYNAFNGFECIIASAYVMLIGSFVPIPGGTGGLEYGFIQFFGNFISGSILKSMMLVWRFVTYYLGMIIGGIALNIKDKKEE